MITTRPPHAGDALPTGAAHLVPLDPGLYLFRLAAVPGLPEAGPGFAPPVVHVCSPPQSAAIEIVDDIGRNWPWLGERDEMLLVKAPAGGASALVTAYLAGDPDSTPLTLEISRINSVESGGGAAGPPLFPVMTLSLGGSPAPGRGAGIEVVAHIHGRGDVRFADTPWIGRLGPGLWIEALTIQPLDPSVAAAIEYKGLTAGGMETPWLASGSPCGTRGRSLPLVGFALRQKADAGGGARFDCECTGYFASGASAGPARNGAPCRSPVDNDPLEGIQLRITRRATTAGPDGAR
jgi:hypothetical protein